MAHVSGLVAADLYPSPVPYADVVTSTTHKTLRGPRSGIILAKANEEIEKKLNSAVFPGSQGGPLMHVVAAKALCFKEALDPEFKIYIKQVMDNAKTMAETIMSNGIDIVSNGTENHIILVDLRSKGITGKDLERVLGSVNITVNKNSVPNDPASPFVTSGIRIGTPAATTRGFKEEEIIFKNTEVDILENTSSSKEAVDNAIDAGRIVIAADSLGASKAMLDKAIEYSKERKQFNRAIGSFQAVKHMCAEMAAELEPCYSILWHAAHSFDSKEKNKKIMACHAKSHISDISKMISKKATEVHGGMGFTDLLGLHYWFKRIGVNRQMLGSPEIVREEAAKSQGL